MPFRPSQRLPVRLVLVGLLAATAGGCMSRDPSATGSIARADVSDAEMHARVEQLGRQWEADGANPDLAVAFAGALRARGQTAQAVAVLQQGALRSPGHTGVLAAYGKVLADAGRLKEAADVLASAHRPERPDWRILSAQGAVADQMNQFATAQRYYEAALKIVPGEPSVLSNQGLSFALARRLDEAEGVLREAMRHPRADARVGRNLELVLALRKGRGGSGPVPVASNPRRDFVPVAAPATVAERRPSSGGGDKQVDSWRALRQLDDAAGGSGASRQLALGAAD